MATAIFQPNEALLAALAGANYIAPYVGRMFDSGIDAYAALQSRITMYQQYGFTTKILTAALRMTEQITRCAEMGIDAMTLKPSLFSQWTADDPETIESLRAFADDWEARSRNSTGALLL